MAVYQISGQSIETVYDLQGNVLSQAYDINGNPLLSGGDDYSIWETEYQHTILKARDAWAADYRRDPSIIPIMVHTDQHRHLNSSNKPTFTYLSKAVKWDEVTAMIGLGDVCGAVYNTTDLNNMTNCLSPVSKSKRIDIAGNHDCQRSKTGDGYAYSYLTADQFAALQETYFNNSQFGSNSRYGVYGMETMVDQTRHIRFNVFAVWHTGSPPDYAGGQPWYAYKLTSEDVDAMISMLSIVDNNDVVILSHIQPYAGKVTRYKPAVDDRAEAVVVENDTTGDLSYSTGSKIILNQLYADRKAKRAGTIKDIDGNVHSYDFSHCTSDLLCSLSGHSHADYVKYSPDGTVPGVVFDAYAYDAHPLFMVNIDRNNKRLNIWKFDTANQIYNYQIPFNESDDTTKYLSEITVTYNGGPVVEGTTLDQLTGITVTRNYADGTAAELSSGWTLTGSLAVGNNTITLTYSQLIATFNVTVVEDEEVTL